jgi:hypothetical protein
MKHLHKFEAFIIPKALRKFKWSDEDIALHVLKEIEDLHTIVKKSGKNTIDFKKEIVDGQFACDFYYTFEIDDYEFRIKYVRHTGVPGRSTRLTEYGYMYLNGRILDVSKEVCIKIYDTISRIRKEESEFEENSIHDDNKKGFRIRKGLI